MVSLMLTCMVLDDDDDDEEDAKILWSTEQ